jgi:DNA-binding response OmpR family regulator
VLTGTKEPAGRLAAKSERRPEVPRIAILEDEPSVRSMIHLVLTAVGYEAILIDEHGDLLAQLITTRPALVLLDLVLGGWSDGLVLAASIRADPLLRHTPIIITSAAQNILRQHADALLALRCHVLEKPFDLADLLALIEGALAVAQN